MGNPIASSWFFHDLKRPLKMKPVHSFETSGSDYTVRQRRSQKNVLTMQNRCPPQRKQHGATATGTLSSDKLKQQTNKYHWQYDIEGWFQAFFNLVRGTSFHEGKGKTQSSSCSQQRKCYTEKIFLQDFSTCSTPRVRFISATHATFLLQKLLLMASFFVFFCHVSVSFWRRRLQRPSWKQSRPAQDYC